MPNPKPSVLLSSLLLLGTLACGGSDPKPASKPVKPSGPSAGTPTQTGGSGADEGSQASSGIDRRDRGRGGSSDEPVADGPPGSIVGMALFPGEAPERKPLKISSSAGCPNHAQPMSETMIVNDGKLANVFVYVSKGVPSSAEFEAPAEPLALSQEGCVYGPHVSAAMVGQTIQVSNGDPTSHNVHVVAKRNPATNQNQSAGSAPLELVFDQEEVPVTFVCDIHPWMKAYVCIQDHPFWAVSAEDGSFRIDDLPPGKYTLTTWHEVLDRQRLDVVVQPEAETEVQFTFED